MVHVRTLWFALLMCLAATALAGCTSRPERTEMEPDGGDSSPTATVRPRPTPRPTREPPRAQYEPECHGSRFEACLDTTITIDTPGVTSPDCSGTEWRICLVPVGAVRPDLVQHLSEHFRGMGIPVEVLPGIDLPRGRTDVRHSQAVTRDVMELMRAAYPAIGNDYNYHATAIAITPVDVRSQDDAPGNFLFAQTFGSSHESYYGVISTFRFNPETFGEPADDALFFERVRKMTLKYIGSLHFGYPQTESEDSVMRTYINSLRLLDRLPEKLPDQPPPCQQPTVRLCLVPVGDVDPNLLARLAAEATATYGIPVDVLPGVELDSSYRNLVGNGDYSDDNLINMVLKVYPGRAQREPRALMVAVTPVQIFSFESLRDTENAHVVTSQHPDFAAAVISIFGWDVTGAPPQLTESRLRKAIAREIGLLYLGMPPDDDPNSLLRRWLHTPEELDALPERLPGY